MGGQQSGLFSQALAAVGPSEVYQGSMLGQNNSPSVYGRTDLFPANLFYEGHDQHQRWFLTSLVSSVALTGQAPFTNLKTHGHLLNDQGTKMSKSDHANRTSVIDPMDLIDGTVKLDGNRSHGYGLDTMRLWSISKDSDKDCFLEKKEVELVN